MRPLASTHSNTDDAAVKRTRNTRSAGLLVFTHSRRTAASGTSTSCFVKQENKGREEKHTDQRQRNTQKKKKKNKQKQTASLANMQNKRHHTYTYQVDSSALPIAPLQMQGVVGLKLHQRETATTVE
jgi:hypothetical protein